MVFTTFTIPHGEVRPRTYKACLYDGSGTPVGLLAGAATARRWVTSDSGEESVASAVETMYEEIAEKLLAPALRPPSPPSEAQPAPLPEKAPRR